MKKTTTTARYANNNQISIPKARALLKEMETKGTVVQTSPDYWESVTPPRSIIQEIARKTGQNAEKMADDLVLETIKRHMAWNDNNITAVDIAITACIGLNDVKDSLKRLTNKKWIVPDVNYRLMQMYILGRASLADLENKTTYQIANPDGEEK